MEVIAQDLKFAARVLIARPAFALTVVRPGEGHLYVVASAWNNALARRCPSLSGGHGAQLAHEPDGRFAAAGYAKRSAYLWRLALLMRSSAAVPTARMSSFSGP